VKGDCRNTTLFELTSKTVSTVLGTGEDNCAVVFFNNVSSHLWTLVTWNTPEEVVNITRSFFSNNVVDNGIVSEFFYE
jgi:hypothetical protein